jgi:hypothetical protein
MLKRRAKLFGLDTQPGASAPQVTDGMLAGLFDARANPSSRRRGDQRTERRSALAAATDSSRPREQAQTIPLACNTLHNAWTFSALGHPVASPSGLGYGRPWTMHGLEPHAERKDAPAPARAVPAAPPIALVMRLQCGAGNAAVTRMLQRYDAFEHAGEGDHAKGSQKVKVGTETLTSGEINALADLYGSPADLMKADAKEVSALVALVRRQVAGGKVEESEWDAASGGRYNRLNLKNSPHFSPRNAAMIAPPPGGAATGGDNLSTFTQFYTDTVGLIEQRNTESDAAKKQELQNKTIVTAGFAEHYLMDAFSAGHLFNKDDFIAALKANLDALPPAQLTALFNSIAKGVLADKTSHDLLDKYETVDRHYGFHPNFSREAAFQGLLEELYKDTDGRQAVYSGLVKVVHDELSTRKAGTMVGVPVENAYEKWTLSGDRTLATSPDTQRIIDQALEQFRALMTAYRTAPRTLPSPTADITKVTDFFPKPTAASVTMISDLVKKVTDAGTGTIASLIAILKAELPSILEALEARKKIRKA